MALATNIVRRGGSASWYVRAAVPKDIRDAIGGPEEVWRSLRERDPAKARRKAPEVLAALHAEWESVRASLAPATLDPGAVNKAVADFYRAELDADEAARRSLPTSEDLDALEEAAVDRLQASADAFRALPLPERRIAVFVETLDHAIAAEVAGDRRREREALAAEVRRHAASGETALITWAADAMIARQGLKIIKGSPAYRELCQRLQRAQLEALKRADERDAGKWDGEPTDPSVTTSGETITEAFAAYRRDVAGRLSADTLRQSEACIGMFADFVGPGFAMARVTKKEVRAWKEALYKLPVKAADTNEFRGLRFRDVIKRNERVGKPTITPKTINKYLSALGSLCTWAVANGHLESNPVEGLYIALNRDVQKVRPYDVEQLTKIFSSPLFTGCQSEDKPHLPGNVHRRDHFYWAPLIALYTGARLGEIVQLETADVREIAGRWAFHVTREGDPNKRTKTKGSQRVIPVHPELIRLGFLAYHAKAAKAGQARLFPDVKPDSRGFLSGNVSREWGRYLARIGLKEDASVNFHSFRHGLADAFRRAGYRDEEFAMMLGHGSTGTTGRYGVLREGEMTRLGQMIDAVSFPGLDLSHLYAA